MNILTVMNPIKKDLDKFAKELTAFIDSVENAKVKENYRTFFAKRGKHIRPSLLFLAYGASGGDLVRSASAEYDQGSQLDKDKLYKLGLVLELLHSASLIHDDIIDGDDFRRGNRTVNSVFGNKVGVLAGDTLFSYAFALATDLFESDYNKLITGLALEMCTSELIQANSVDSKEDYLRVIRGKTAQFMSVSCELGAMFGGASDEIRGAMRDYGMNLGMTYQIIDDFSDDDPNAAKFIEKTEADIYYKKAVENLKALEGSTHKKAMKGLLDFVMAM